MCRGNRYLALATRETCHRKCRFYAGRAGSGSMRCPVHRDPNQVTRFRSQALVTRSASVKHGWGPSRPGHVDEWTEILHSDLRWAVTRTHTHAHALAAPAPPPPGSRPWSLPPPCRSPRQPVLSGPRACCLHSQLHPARERRGAAAGFTSCACACSPWGDAQPWSTLHKHLPSNRSQEPTAVHSPQLPAAPPGPARRLRLSRAAALTSRGPGTHSAADEDSV